MNDEMCGKVRELIPDFVAGRLSAGEGGTVEGHVAECPDCAAEVGLVRMIFASRLPAPSGLLDRLLQSAVSTAAQPVGVPRTWWGLAAAAVAALALGIGLSSDPSATVPIDVPDYAYEVEEGDIWVSDDGLVAGAPHFDDLSDDALLELLDELSVGSAGGSA